MAVRKQLKHDETTDIWPITDASAVHYTYNPSDALSITSPVPNTSYGLDSFLNGLLNRFLTRDEVAVVAYNILAGKGLLYNSALNTTSTALPSSTVTNAIVRCTYDSSGNISISFDTTAYLPTNTSYAAGQGPNGNAMGALALIGGGPNYIPYLISDNSTGFIPVGSSGQVLLCGGSSSPPMWTDIENYLTVTLVNDASYTLSLNNWLPTSNNPISNQIGTYAIYIKDAGYGSYSGMFAINNTSSALDEIPLHWASESSSTSISNRIYAATLEGKILLSSNNSSGTVHLVTIKYKRII